MSNPSIPRKPPPIRKLAPPAPGLQKEKENAESLYQELLQNIYDAALITDLKGKILSVNVRAIEFLLYEREEFSDLRIFNVVSGADESLLHTILQNLENQTFTHIEGYCLRKDGSLFPTEIVANRLQHAGKDQLCFFVRDITRRKLTEEELRKSEAKNRALLHAIPDLMLRIDKEGTLLDFKASTENVLTALNGSSLGKKVSEVFPKLASQFMHHMERTFQTEEAQIFEYEHQQAGVKQNYEVRIVLSEGSEVLAIVRDITERKKAEEAEKERVYRDLEIAREIQQHLLPAAFPKIEGMQVSATNVAALKVGGDYYDIIQVDEYHWGFAIADVSGKGVSGALIMAICRSALRSKAERTLSPAKVLKEVNRVVQPDMQEDMFISAIYGVMDVRTREFTFCRAGHEPLLIYRQQAGSEEILSPKGMPLGLMAGKPFDSALEEKTTVLQKGDSVIFYTDGITEALNKDSQEFGRVQLIESIKECGDKGAEEMTRSIEKRIRRFVGNHPQSDDITLMVLRV